MLSVSHYLFLFTILFPSYCFQFTWPPSDTEHPVYVSKTIDISKGETFNGEGKTYIATDALGKGDQSEHQLPLFLIHDGGIIKNVIIDIDAADGIHCLGDCTIENVFWLKVGEDAATLKESKENSNPTMMVIGGGARNALDKVFQHDGPGIIHLQGFQAEDFGKLYRSCGNCKTQYNRNVILENVSVSKPDKSVVAINGHYENVPNVNSRGDTARIRNLKVYQTKAYQICEKFVANNLGKEPGPPYASGADGRNCLYGMSDVIYH